MSVFDQNTSDKDSNSDSTLFNDKLKEIVNENGEPKYKDVNTAIEALKASQDHIKRLEKEAADRIREREELAAKAAKAETLEEIVARLTNNSASNEKPRTETPANNGISEDKIAELVANQLAKREQTNQAQKNVQDVTTALTAKFGDVEKTKAAVSAKAAELGTTAEQLGFLSSQNPKLVLSLFGVGALPTTSNPTTTSNNSSLNTPPSEGLKRPEKSLLSGSGATDKNRKDMMAKIKENIYKKYDVTV